MSAITPPQAAGPTATVAAASGMVQVSNPPRTLLNLALESVVKGEVIALPSDGKGGTILRTPVGPLTLAGNPPLPLGATVTLSLQTVGAATQMLLLTINGKPFASSRGAALTGSVSPQAGQQGGAAQTGATPGAAQVTAGQAGSVARPNPLVPGALIQTSLNKAAPGTATAPSDGGTAVVRHGGLTLQPGAPVQARVIAIGGAPQGATTAPVAGTAAAPEAPANPARLVSGTVVASNSGGQPLLQSPLGWLTLPMGSKLPAGSTVTLELIGSDTRAASATRGDAPAPTAESPARATARALAAEDALLRGFGTRRWDSMNEALGVLRAADPAMAQSVLQNAMPQANAQLTTNMLFFISALRGGDLRGWLGDNAMRTLERAGRGDLVNRLSEEFSQLGRAVNESAADWRMMLVPFYNQQQVEQLRMYWRRGGEDDDGDSSRVDTRFVIDVELSRMGHLQLDGLVRPRRLDLVIRTAEALPSMIRREINDVFTTASEATGMAGTLSFQARGDFVEIAPPSHPSGTEGGLVV